MDCSVWQLENNSIQGHAKTQTDRPRMAAAETFASAGQRQRTEYYEGVAVELQEKKEIS